MLAITDYESFVRTMRSRRMKEMQKTFDGMQSLAGAMGGGGGGGDGDGDSTRALRK